MRRRRGLSADELALWHKFTLDITPLPDKPRPDALPPATLDAPSPAPAVMTPAPKSNPPPRPNGANLALESKALRRLARGHLHPDGRLDLHGMTQDHAFSALSRFIHHQQARGARLVLIITGKGRPDSASVPVLSDERGVLRRMVPLWLRQPDLAGLIVGISPAHPRHGGDGALYVHLRRPKG